MVAVLAVAVSAPAAARQAPEGFELSVIVDGRTAPEYALGGRLYVEARKGCEFSLRLHNPSTERVAVAISVDGRNVIDAKRTTASGAAKWILGPGQTIEVPGWQVSGEAARRFFFTEIFRSYARWLGDASNTGVIEAVFFRERRLPVAPIAPSQRQRPDGLPDRDRPRAAAPQDRGAAGRTEETEPGDAAPPEAGAGSDALGRDARPQHKAVAPEPLLEKDELAATGMGERTDFRVRAVHFDPDPVPAARVRIRYEFRAELVRLGILPRETVPSWRDGSRGFEPDYAPDPYRRRDQP